MVPVIEGYGYPPHQAAAVATFFVAAFRGLLIDLVANEEDPRRLDDAMEIFIGMTGGNGGPKDRTSRRACWVRRPQRLGAAGRTPPELTRATPDFSGPILILEGQNEA